MSSFVTENYDMFGAIMEETAKKGSVKQQVEGLLDAIQQRIAEAVVYIAENNISRAETNLRAAEGNVILAKQIAAKISN